MGSNIRKQIEAQLKQRILLIDGGMGTMIQGYKLEEQEYRGERFSEWHCDLKGNNDLLVLSQPQIISEIHHQYLEAGADILETNTFNATTIAITAGALMLSLLIIIAGQNDWFQLTEVATDTMATINFEDFLLKGILGFLLFAGGLGIKLPNLKDQKWEITTLALGATLFSTFFIGFILYTFCQLIGIDFDLVYCLLFGSLISPTDPIAVLAIVNKVTKITKPKPSLNSDSPSI